MSEASESLLTLHYSPYILAPLFSHFYSKNVEMPKDVLLAYLILPLVFPSNTRKFFKNAKTTSSLYTFWEKKNLRIGIEERAKQFQEITNKCLLVTQEMGSIKLNNDMSINYTGIEISYSFVSEETVEATKNLSRMLYDIKDIPACYRLLGVRQL